MADDVWECSCGHVEYGDLPPVECLKCFAIESFVQLPEELIEEREKDNSVEKIEDQLKDNSTFEEEFTFLKQQIYAD